MALKLPGEIYWLNNPIQHFLSCGTIPRTRQISEYELLQFGSTVRLKYSPLHGWLRSAECGEPFNLFCGTSEGDNNSDQNGIHLSRLPPAKFWWSSHTETINCCYSMYCLRNSQQLHLGAAFCICLHCQFWPQWDISYSSI